MIWLFMMITIRPPKFVPNLGIFKYVGPASSCVLVIKIPPEQPALLFMVHI